MSSTSVNWWLELVKLRWLYGSKSEKAVYFGKLKARVSETREEFTEVKGRKPSTSVIQKFKKETHTYIKERTHHGHQILGKSERFQEIHHTGDAR
jgi:hypothetical protein